MHSVPLNKGRESSSTTRKESIDRVSLERPSCFFPLILLWMRPHFVSTLTLKWKFWSRPTLEKKLVKTMQWKNGGGQASVRSLPSFPWFFFEWGLILCRLLLWSENSYIDQLLEKKLVKTMQWKNGDGQASVVGVWPFNSLRGTITLSHWASDTPFSN